MEIKCPCCGEPMDAFTQTYPEKYRIPAKTFVTCKTDGCPAQGYTLTPEAQKAFCEKASDHAPTRS